MWELRWNRAGIGGEAFARSLTGDFSGYELRWHYTHRREARHDNRAAPSVVDIQRQEASL